MQNFIGFPALYLFLKRYAFSAIGFPLIIGAFTVAASFFWEGVFFNDGGFNISMPSLLSAAYCVTSVIVAMGANLGKLTPFSMTLGALMQVIGFWALQYQLTDMQVFDAGKSLNVHVYGNYFGLSQIYKTKT